MHLTDTFIQSDLQSIQVIPCFVSMVVPWESNPQPFALLTQCSTTEPHRNTYTIYYRANLGVSVWMSECGLYVVVKNGVCSCNIWERKTTLQITNPTTVSTSGVLLASNWGNMVLRPTFFLLKAYFLRYPEIWYTTCWDLWHQFYSRFKVQHIS